MMTDEERLEDIAHAIARELAEAAGLEVDADFGKAAFDLVVQALEIGTGRLLFQQRQDYDELHLRYLKMHNALMGWQGRYFTLQEAIWEHRVAHWKTAAQFANPDPANKALYEVSEKLIKEPKEQWR